MALRPLPEVWMDDRLVVRRSPIEGSGLFARDALAEGTIVLRLGGKLVTSAELATLIDIDTSPGTA